jgi:hypothetical protein
MQVGKLKLVNQSAELLRAAKDLKAWVSVDTADFTIRAGETDLALIATAQESVLVPLQYLLTEQHLTEQQQGQAALPHQPLPPTSQQQQQQQVDPLSTPTRPQRPTSVPEYTSPGGSCFCCCTCDWYI